MDQSNFLSVYQPFSSSPMETAIDFKSENSLMILSQSKVSSLNNTLLQVLFPSEDKVKSYLYHDHQQENNENSDCDKSIHSSNTMNLNVDNRLYFKNNYCFGPKRPEFDYLNTYDMASASMYSDIIDCLVSYLVNCNNLSLSAIDPNYYENTDTYHQYYEDYQVLQPNQRFTYNDYVKLRGNTSLLVRLGYKMTLKLNTDNEVQEIWNQDVAQKILSVDYSHLSLVKDFYQVQEPLDQLECFLLSELVKAFQDTEPIKWPEFSFKVKTSPSPLKFVSIFRQLKSFRKICNHDKIILLSNSFYEIFSEKMVFDYNQTTDEWINPEYGTRFGRRDLFIWNRLLYDKVIPVIETLPDRWRNDEVVKALISVIIIFNPDLIGLLSADLIRYEQYVYIHLLKRYLESVCESPCDASDNLYRLMVGVEKFRELGKIVFKSMNEFETGFHRSLLNLIINVINNKCD